MDIPVAFSYRKKVNIEVYYYVTLYLWIWIKMIKYCLVNLVVNKVENVFIILKYIFIVCYVNALSIYIFGNSGHT